MLRAGEAHFPASYGGVDVKPGAKRVVIAAVVAVAVIATMGEGSSSGGGDASSDQATSQNGTNTTEEQPTDADAGSTYGIGDPAPDGKFEFTVSAVKCGVKKVGSEFLEAKAQGQFCLVTMSVKNIGDESQLFDAGSQKGLTNTGATVDADGSASLYANEDGGSFLEEINPGNSIKDVVVVYDIAPDQTLDAVQLFDSLFSGGVTVSLS